MFRTDDPFTHQKRRRRGGETREPEHRAQRHQKTSHRRAVRAFLRRGR